MRGRLKVSINIILKIQRFLKLSRLKRHMLTEVIVYMGVARLAMLILPFRVVCRFLGKQGEETSCVAYAQHQETLSVLSCVLYQASRDLPWQCQCLVQAIAGMMVLKRRRLSSTLYLGVAKNKEGRLDAHAWLRCGEYTIGMPDLKAYKVLSCFARD